MTVRPLLSRDALEAWTGCAFPDRDRAEGLLDSLADAIGGVPAAIPTVECLIPALASSPDPEMSLVNFGRWAAGLPTPAATWNYLRTDPRMLEDLSVVFGASQYLSDILSRDPWLYSLFSGGCEPRGAAEYRQTLAAALRPLKHPEARRDALRRVKRREFLRIGWMDLARRAPLEQVVRQISDLADALIEGALQLAREALDPRFPTAAEAVRLCVLAMGKLGARELNYSSDVDLVFVMDSDTPLDEVHRRYATRLAEAFIAMLAQETGEGRCFRVDMRLRPEGRAGALVRSIGSFRQYYDRWAETWERQALIKVRPVAGDPELGRQFEELVRPVVYRRLQGASLLEDVRDMRTAVERKLAGSGVHDIHVKEGRGTIRDVEFTVQLLQLLFGADQTALQTSDTLTTLQELQRAEMLTPSETKTFQDGYRFFREVEHRLQLMHDLPVRVIPSESRDLRRLGATLGLPSAEAFLEVFRRRQDAVRALAEEIQGRLGVQAGRRGGDLRDALLSADTPDGAIWLREHLASLGLLEVDEAVEALVRLAAGPPRYPHPSAARRLFGDLGPEVLARALEAPDPAKAMTGLADYADRTLLHRALYQSLLEQPESTQRHLTLAGAATTAYQTILKYPELADLMTDPTQSAEPRGVAALVDDLRGRLSQADSHSLRLSVLRRFKQREFVRIAAGMALGSHTSETITAWWADTAEALLKASLAVALRRLHEEGRRPDTELHSFAIVALGRLGGRDLHYASDLDLVYLFDSAAGHTQQSHELVARALSEVLKSVTEDGSLFEVDLRLRPEGRQGFGVVSLDAIRRYYGAGGRGQTWEFQMLTRARAVAGCESAAAAFLEAVAPQVYRTPMPTSWNDEIGAMKVRIETERVDPQRRERHLKLGPGGLSDIEFTLQLLQLRHGGRLNEVRTPGTLAAMRALCGAGLLSESDAAALEEAHGFLTACRQWLTLQSPEGDSNLLPVDRRLAHSLARALGLAGEAALLARHQCLTAQVRSIWLATLANTG